MRLLRLLGSSVCLRELSGICQSLLLDVKLENGLPGGQSEGRPPLDEARSLEGRKEEQKEMVTRTLNFCLQFHPLDSAVEFSAM